MDKLIKLQILEYNYWEHFKAAKDMAMVLPLEDKRRKTIEKELNNIQEKIQVLKKTLSVRT